MEASEPILGRIERSVFDSCETLGQRTNAVAEGLAAAFGDDLAEHLDQLTNGQRAFAALEWAIRMTYASGFQCLYELDAPPGLLDELGCAAEVVGAPSYAALFSDGLAALPSNTLSDWERRLEFVSQNDDVFDRLDDRFYALEDSGDVLVAQIVRYIETNPREFFL